MFVLHGASKISTPALAKLLQTQASTRKHIIVLLDPDVAGRQSRALVDKCLDSRCSHAFIPVLQATAAMDVRYSSILISAHSA